MAGLALGLAVTASVCDAAPAIVNEIVNRGATKTYRLGVRACPVGHAMSGLHAANDELLCLRMQRTGYTLGAPVKDAGMTATNQYPGGRYAPMAVQTSGGTLLQQFQGPEFHFCGDRRVMVGIDPGANTFLCSEWTRSGDAGLVGGGLGTVLDLPPGVTVRAGMHACPPGSAMMGIHVDGNIFLCGTVYDAPPPFAPGDRVVGSWIGICSHADVRVFFGTSSSYTTVDRGQTDRSAFIAAGSGSAHVIRWQCRPPQGQPTNAFIMCPVAANVVQLTRSANAGDARISVKCTERNPLY